MASARSEVIRKSRPKPECVGLTNRIGRSGGKAELLYQACVGHVVQASN